MRVSALVISFLVTLLCGCSTLSRDSGYEVQTMAPVKRQEPWQNQALPADTVSHRGIAVVVVKWPNPLPNEWRSDFVDPARVYEVPTNTGNGMNKKQTIARKPVVRFVFRANVYRGTVYETTVPVVVADAPYDSFHVLVPYEAGGILEGKHILILSSDGRWGMTAAGESVSLKGLNLTHLPVDFFDQLQPSVVRNVLRLDALSEDGQRYIHKLDERFYRTYEVDGKTYLFMGDTLEVLARFSSLNGVSDRLVTCTSLKLGAHSLEPFAWVMYGIQAGIVLAEDDCLRPSPLATREAPASRTDANRY